MPVRFAVMLSRGNNGFTLIELMIVVAIIFVLASLAVSAYQTYTVRSQVSEGLDFANTAKANILDVYLNAGAVPANRAAARMTPLSSDSRGAYVSDVEVRDGRIDITFGGHAAHPDIIGKTISLTPYLTSEQTVEWRCGLAPPPAGSPLTGAAAHRDPSVDLRYLPSNCR